MGYSPRADLDGGRFGILEALFTMLTRHRPFLEFEAAMATS